MTSGETSAIRYQTVVGSLEYVADMILGETDQAGFSSGHGSMDFLLHLLFWSAAFIIMLHLLNMLIAIMGNTFDVGNQSAEQQKYREHLRFVVDNWFMRKLAFREIHKVKYIITAFSALEHENDDQAIFEMREEIANS